MLDTKEVIMKNSFSKNYLFLVSIFFLLSCSSFSSSDESPTASDESTTASDESTTAGSTDNTTNSLDLSFAISSTYPTEASTGISRSTTISLTFDREIDNNTINIINQNPFSRL